MNITSPGGGRRMYEPKPYPEPEVPPEHVQVDISLALESDKSVHTAPIIDEAPHLKSVCCCQHQFQLYAPYTPS